MSADGFVRRSPDYSWVARHAEWYRSITPAVDATAVADAAGDGGVRVHNFHSMTPDSAARALGRVFRGRDLVASVGAPVDPLTAGRVAVAGSMFGGLPPSSSEPLQAQPISDPEAGSVLDADGYVVPQPGTVPNPGAHTRPPDPDPQPNSVPDITGEVPVPNTETGETNPPSPAHVPLEAEMDAGRVETILPEGLEAPQRGGPGVHWLEGNGTQGSLHIDEFGQRHWRFTQADGVVIDVTEGGGSDGADRPWTHTTITEPGQSAPRVDTYDTTGVTVNVETTTDIELHDLRFQGGDRGLEEHHGGSDGADRPWVRTTQFTPSTDPNIPPTHWFTTSTSTDRAGNDLTSGSSWADEFGTHDRLEDWTNDERTDTITGTDPATGQPLTYVSVQRLSDRTPLLDSRTGADGVTHVIDHTVVDQWGNPAAYQIHPDHTLWDRDGNQIGIADGKLVPFDADGNYLSTGTDGVSVRDADTDEPIRSNDYQFWAIWLTPDEREVIEPLTRVHAPLGGPAQAYFRTPNGELIVQDDNGFHQVDNAPTLSQLVLYLELNLLADGITSGGAGWLARLGSRPRLGRPQRPQLGQRSVADDTASGTGSTGPAIGDGATSTRSNRTTQAENTTVGNGTAGVQSEVRTEVNTSSRTDGHAAILGRRTDELGGPPVGVPDVLLGIFDYYINAGNSFRPAIGEYLERHEADLGKVASYGWLTGGRRRPRDILDDPVQTKWAEDAYADFVQNFGDVSAISRNTRNIPRPGGSMGFSEEEVAAIKKHLFDTEHPIVDSETGEVVIRKFDADAEIADAWIRLRSKNSVPEDYVLLEHELAELNYLRRNPEATYQDAHAVANELYDWESSMPLGRREDFESEW